MEAKNSKIVGAYARFVSRNYLFLAVLVITLTIASSILSANVRTTSMSYKNMVPNNMPAMQTMNLISDSFGGTSSATFVLQIDPRYAGSDEIRDLRDYRAMEYMDTLSSVLARSESVIGTTSPASSIKALNGGVIPKSNLRIREIMGFSPGSFARSISGDYRVASLSVSVNDDVDQAELTKDLQLVLQEVPPPPGIGVSITGEPVQSAIVQSQIGPDIAKTSGISFFLIAALCVLVFGSIVYGLIPLSTIAIGVIWLMGFLGLMGTGLSAMTSGAISMIMGIGIDFGIQITMRFRDEYEKHRDAGPAIEKTMNETLMPMFTTTLAALIGFQAMSLGQLKLLGELGTMMSYGVVACFLAAITLVPAILMVEKKHNPIKFLKGE
jgi:predicted RND superfamily exporter protein